MTHLKIVINKSTENRCTQLFIDSLKWIPDIKELTLTANQSQYDVIPSSDFLLNLKATTITTLNLRGILIMDLDWFKKLNLKKIDIDCYGFWSADFLTKPIFPNLESLALANYRFKSKEKIIENMNLKELKLINVFIPTHNFNFLNAYPNLTSLQLMSVNCKEIQIAFDELINLQKLMICGRWIISGLDKLKKLSSLNLDRFSKAEQDQVAPIASQLTCLKFSIDDLEDLNEKIAEKVKTIYIFSREFQPRIHYKVADILKQYNHSITMNWLG